MIPQVNPAASYAARRAAVISSIQRVLESGNYVLGQEVACFEREFATAMGASWAVGVASGTDAIELALRALGVRSGSAVATVSHTAVATVAAILRLGAYPVFVDIEPRTFCMSAESLRLVLGNAAHAIDAIIVVHLYGQPADLRNITAIANEFGVPLIEDCAQAHAATLDGRPVGTWGAVGCFSFYPTKNLGGIGDGGAVIGGEASLEESVRLLRQYGWKERYVSSVSGFNSRLDELQAAVLRVKLRGLDTDNARRRRLADLYDAELADADLVLPERIHGEGHVFHQYVVMHDWRDELQAFLRAKGIGTQIHYPLPVHLQPAISHGSFAPVSLRNTELIVERILSLPMYPELDEWQVLDVCSAIKSFVP